MKIPDLEKKITETEARTIIDKNYYREGAGYGK